MENLYNSLFDLLDDDGNDNSDLINIIGKISGNNDINAQSMYFNIDDYKITISHYKNYYSNAIHVHFRSLPKNFDILNSVLHYLPKHPDIIALTETWLSDTTKHLYFMEGFSAFHLVRTNREHGGICDFVRNGIHTDVVNDYCLINDEIELYTIKIIIDTVKYIIATVYRPHSKHIAINDFTDFLVTTLSTDLFRCNKIIILRDFNINLLEHPIHLPTNIFINAMHAINYFPHISRPTRFPDNPHLSKSSLLDHIWTNFTPPSLSCILYFSVSYHLPVFINIIRKSAPNSKHKKFSDILASITRKIYKSFTLN